MLMRNGVTYVASILVLCGILVACSPIQTPIAIATATVIPSTATATYTPTIPTEIPSPSSTPISLQTTTTSEIIPILETSIDFDDAFVQELMQALAAMLNTPINRIQLVTVEQSEWDIDTLGCSLSDALAERVTINSNQEDIVTGFKVVLLVGNTLYDYHTEATSRYLLCDEQRIIRDDILLAVDPLAAETFRVVQDLLGEELDLSSRRVQLVTMLPVTWSDTSLGCPQADQTYTTREIPGYHLVVTVGNETYIYHSDSNTVYLCDAENSIIPLNS